ncbi:MAG: hypothetical protein IT207_11885 [Fimbriimonadaceae bacterium]|nr:hypothetical protein [Fimbriimonadaceae bacterium]
MAFLIITPDGSQTTVDSAASLRALQLDGRIPAGSQVMDLASRRQLSEAELDSVLAGSSPNLGTPVRRQAQESLWPIASIVLWSVGGVVWFFVFKGWGFIIAAFTLWDAVRLKASGSKWGNLGLAVAGIAALAIAWGWYDRATSTQPAPPNVQAPSS